MSQAFVIPVGLHIRGVENAQVLAHASRKRACRRTSHVVAVTSSSDSLQTSLCDALRKELPLLFEKGPSYMDTSLYAPDVKFRDPLNRFQGIKRYKQNIEFLNTSPVFSGTKLDMHDIWALASDLAEAEGYKGPTVRTRWTLSMTANLPWRPRISFTGISDYVMDPDSGKIILHVDMWDSLDKVANSTFPSVKGIKDLVSQCVLKSHVPDENGSPRYDLLRRTDDYVIRRYSTLSSADIPPLDLQASSDLSKYSSPLQTGPTFVEGNRTAALYFLKLTNTDRSSDPQPTLVAFDKHLERHASEVQTSTALVVAVQRLEPGKMKLEDLRRACDSLAASVLRDNSGYFQRKPLLVFLAHYSSPLQVSEIWIRIDKVITRSSTTCK